MKRATDEQLFLRFRQRGDAKALGRLFDRTAGDLFQLALYLAPQASEAEDLLQATFLTAIENAGRFDPRRRLLPWLIGILANHARRLRRQRRRPVPELLPLREVPDPACEAEAEEVRRCLGRSLQHLPQPYRQVLTLHLEHGLCAREIGEVLERPAGTVRSQVVRGLELLRRALPAGLAPALALLLTPGHALAGVRAEVLRAAERAAPLPSGWPWAWPAATGLAAAAAGLLWLLPVLSPPPPAGPEATAASRLAPVPAAAEVAAAARPGASLTRSLSATADAGEDAPGTGGAEIEVRFAGTGEPATGLRLLVAPFPGPWDLLHRGQLDPAARTLEVGAGGRLSLTGLPAGHYAAWPAGSGMRIEFDVAGGRTSRARMAVARRGFVHGRVLDEQGRPVAGASVHVSASMGIHDIGIRAAETGADGRFAFVVAEPQVDVWATARGRQPSPAAKSRGRAPLRLQLGSGAAALTGEVADPRGQPVPGALVGLFFAGEEDRFYPPRFARCDAEGRFAFDGLLIGDAAVVARVPGVASPKVRVALRPGRTSHARIDLRPGACLRGRVLDRSGRPQPGRMVFAQPMASAPWQFDNVFQVQYRTTDAEGRYHLHDLPGGPIRLRLVGTDLDRDQHRESLTLDWGERRQFDFVVEDSAVTGTVVDADGAPLAGWRVLATPEGLGGMQVNGHRCRLAVCDQDGAFRLELPEPGVLYRLAVSPPEPARRDEFFAAAVLEHVRPGTAGCRLAVPDDRRPGCRLRGRVFAPEGTPLPATELFLQRLPASHGHLLELREDGSFESRPLVAGRYRLATRHPDYGTVYRTLDLSPGRDLDLGPLQFEVPARLHLTWADPEAASGAVVWIEDEDGAGLALRSATGSDYGALAPGRYVLGIAGPRCPPLRLPLAAAPGQELEVAVPDDPATPCAIGFPFPATDNVFEGGVALHVELRDDAGGIVLEQVLPLDEGRFLWRQALRPGGYHLAAIAPWGARAEMTFSVPLRPEPLKLRAPLVAR